jgi:predicted thioesterase
MLTLPYCCGILIKKGGCNMEITVGMTGSVSTLVERADTAQEVGSGDLLVYATPCMVALMEGAACEAIATALPEDKTTVGIELSIRHTSATPVGMEVTASAEVTAVEGNVITFRISALDEAGTIGEGMHKRAIVSSQRFLDKVYTKL